VTGIAGQRVSTGKDTAGHQENLLTPGSNNVIQELLIDKDKLLLPPLYITLDIMAQYIWALDKDGDCFKYI
jgi:hypothetical protein